MARLVARAVKRLLEAAGYDMSRYHEEAFGPTPPEIRAEVKDPRVGMVTVTGVELTPS